MSMGLEEEKVCDPRILYLAGLSCMFAGHDKQKAFSSRQWFWKHSNHVSFLRERLENISQPWNKSKKSLREEKSEYEHTGSENKTSEHRDFKFGFKTRQISKWF